MVVEWEGEVGNIEKDTHTRQGVEIVVRRIRRGMKV